MARRGLRIILQGFAVVIAGSFLLGIAYEQFGEKQDRRRIPQIGRSVDIGGRTLNIFCSGVGQPAVIFESGGAGPGLANEPVQSEVAKFTQACWYDRAGEGWSDPGPFPRTSAAIAGDLHELLRRAGVPPPYILAGASFGGLNARVYASVYPNEVAGIVLIDSAHEDEPSRAPKFYLGHTAPPSLRHPLCLIFRAAAVLGVVRLLNSSPAHGGNPSQTARSETISALTQQPKSIVGNACTGIVLPESYEEGRSVRDLKDVPMIVLTAGKPLDFGDPQLNQQAAEYQQVWIHEIQPKLARLSTRARQIVVQNSNHGSIPPDVVVSAVRDVLTECARAN